MIILTVLIDVPYVIILTLSLYYSHILIISITTIINISILPGVEAVERGVAPDRIYIYIYIYIYTYLEREI